MKEEEEEDGDEVLKLLEPVQADRSCQNWVEKSLVQRLFEFMWPKTTSAILSSRPKYRAG